MGLSIIRYRQPGSDQATWGRLEKGLVYALPWEDRELRGVLEHLAQRRAAAADGGTPTGLSLAEVELLSPLTPASTLLCQGLNYASHQQEAGMHKAAIDPQDNLLFIKSSASLTGADNDIIRPTGCELLDYEAELGLVIGKPIVAPTDVPRDALGDYVAGFIACNDVSARDQQLGGPAMQWFRGKSYRTFCPAGPVLYLLDDGEIDYVDRLNVKLWVNGELRQSASTAQLLHKPHDTLGFASRFANLHPGDCLLTGTPGGVALNMNLKTGLAVLLNMRNDARRLAKLRAAQGGSPDYLRDGDVVELEICSEDGQISLGRQRNRVVPESVADDLQEPPAG